MAIAVPGRNPRNRRTWTLALLRASCLLLVCSRLPAAPTPGGPDSKDCRIGLALSGGAALGLAHIGVLKVLEAEHIPVCYLSGNSMGSIVGGLSACGYSGVQIESIVRCVNWNRLFDDQVPSSALNLEERENRSRFALNIAHRNLVPQLPTGALAAENVYLYFKTLTEEMSLRANWDFDSLVKPYRAIAVDFLTGEKVTFTGGSVADAMRASMAIPGIFAPAWNNGRWLVDGGVVQFLPVDPLKEFKPDFIIAVDLRQPRDLKRIPSLADIAWQSFDIATERDHAEQLALADIVIHPDLTGLSGADFGRAEEFIRRGVQAARKALPELRQKLAGRVLIARRHDLPPHPLPTVRRIAILGLQQTRRWVVRREMKTRPGKLLDLALLIDDLRRIHETGLFYQIDYKLRYVAPDTVNVEINVLERESGTYSLGIRYDEANRFLVGAEVAQNNLLGSGAGVGIGGVLGNPGEAWLRYSGARFFGLPFNYRLQGFLSTNEHRLYRNGIFTGSIYRLQEYGADARVGVNLGARAFLKAGLEARRIRYPTRPDTWPEAERLAAATCEFKVVGPALGVGNGSLHLRLKYGLPELGGDAHFVKAELGLALPLVIARRFAFEPRLTLGQLAGNIHGFLSANDTVTPVAERFRVGGPELAGAVFDEFLVDQVFLAGAKLRFRLFDLFGMRQYPFQFELGADAGTFEPLYRFPGVSRLRQTLYYGASAGVSLNTPIGPVRLGYGLGRGGRRNLYFSAGYNLLPDFPR
jgi:NTE family protein